MIELVVTCLLAAGLEWAPPESWRIEKIVGGGEPANGMVILTWCTPHGVCPPPDRRTRVMLRRAIAAGERVELPQGCTGAAEVKE